MEHTPISMTAGWVENWATLMCGISRYDRDTSIIFHMIRAHNSMIVPCASAYKNVRAFRISFVSTRVMPLIHF